MKKIILILAILSTIGTMVAQNVKISGNKFTVDNSEIWFNGINTPWHLFGDFGRHDFEPEWWSNEFEKYKQNNINLARVWVHMSGEFSPNIDATGFVDGTNDIFWDHMDHLMNVSEENEVYVMPALFSFDITKDGYATTAEWRKWIQSEANIQSYIDNVLIPMLERYDNRTYLLAWEICNEPEWMFENSEHGPQEFNDVQKMHAMLAAAIHENSTKFVTTGSAAPKWNSPIYDDWGDYEGNMFSDEALSAAINNPNAFLDFYQYHWYPWQSEWMSSPFTMTTAEYDVDDRPVIVGESEGNDVCDKYVCQTVSEMYESAYTNGFDGVCAWKTPQNDGHGTFENIAEATNNFYNNHPNLIYPIGSVLVPATGVTLSDDSVIIEESKSIKLTASLIPSNASDKRVTWESSVPTVATISSGTITAILEGETIITVTTNDGSFIDSCVVTVIKREPACANPSSIVLPHKVDGEGEFCWQTSADLSYINSWNTDIIEINGVDITNTYTNSFPDKIDGLYNIYYKGSYDWSHIEVISSDLKSISHDAISNSTDIIIYPNPSSDVVNIKNTINVSSYTILNATGTKVAFKEIADCNSIEIPVSAYSTGSYFVKLQYVDGSVNTKKIVIK
ncbi:Ig-like domain-containing protein [Saccharicrinis aurantiacus]|uniref:Ig-like domain-containing protein n=1 Tax=Saccharicrinis aurantiacus TaxID=1849719 RepID=UPI000838CAA4|nr:Ig-like domain-containing protein [Saccharicrinis aurantiacus]